MPIRHSNDCMTDTKHVWLNEHMSSSQPCEEVHPIVHSLSITIYDLGSGGLLSKELLIKLNLYNLQFYNKMNIQYMISSVVPN